MHTGYISTHTIAYLLISVFAYSCSASMEDTVSPNGKINVSVNMELSSNEVFGQPYFDIVYQDGNTEKPVMSNIRIGMVTDSRSFANNLRLVSVSKPRNIQEEYEMISGKRRHCSNRGTERIYTFENTDNQTLEFILRAYDNGVAFRYKLDAANADTEYILSELTTYPIPDGVNRWLQPYAIDYEGFFPLASNGDARRSRYPNLWGYPALIEPQDSIFILITEANISRGHSGSRLYNGDNSEMYRVYMADEKVAFDSSYISPWRVMMVGSLADIVESTLVTDVSEPNKLENTEWIVPGVSAWIYWAHNHGSRDFQIVKDYIDLAADMGWTYNLIDWEWDVMENGGNISDALQYSLDKGVKPLLWYNSGTSWIGPGAPGPLDRLNTKENREKEYAQLKAMGVAGIKIDFFAMDGAEIMDYYIDLLEDAAKYELMINFHGATIPRGWQRTYPNMLTVEAVYGAEWYNNLPFLTERAAAHNATLPFTRNVIGPMDYTPGTFSDSQHPHITSHGHELALPVIFESALQHMPDKPQTYYSLPPEIKKMLSELPAAWDEIKFLSGYPGIDVIIARRKENKWYIGGINGTDEERTLSFVPDFSQNSTMTLFSDGPDDRSFAIMNSVLITDTNTKISVPCLPRGGFVAVIE